MLDTTVEPAAVAGAESRRCDRFRARHVLWDESNLRRVRNCGRVIASHADGIAVKVTTGKDGSRSAGYAGLQTCGSVWACPVCSAKVSEHRRQEISQALSVWTSGADGDPLRGRIALATFTMRHKKGQRLKTLWDALAYAWHRVVSGRGWKADQLLYGMGLIPFIRVVEVTYGENGWHVHVHALLMLPGDSTDQSVADLSARMFGRWSDALVTKGLTAPLQSVGTDVRLLKGDPTAALGEYFTKAVYSASFEAARADLKDGRMGNRKPFDLLASVVATGDADDLDAWHEWERGSKGRRQIGWSKAARALLADAPELSDEEVADLDAGGEVECPIDADLWAVIRARRVDFDVLAAFGRSKRDGLAYLMGLSPAADEHGAAGWESAGKWARDRRAVSSR